jgi:hypothetical protein
VTITFQLLGGYVLFYRKGPWRFPFSPLAGILGRFTSTPSFETSDAGMRPGIWLRVGSPERIYEYLRCATRLINALSFFATNPLNFLNGDKLDSAKQVQFISALGMLFWDVMSANQTPLMHNRMSFCLSALDKLANIIEAMTGNGISEADAFKKCFSLSTTLGLREIARSHADGGDQTVGTLLRVQARHLLRVQKAVRDQVRTTTTEESRLAWLRSYRNLRHGTFLSKNQFTNLFVGAKGVAPSDMARVVMAMTVGLCLDADRFLNLFAPYPDVFCSGQMRMSPLCPFGMTLHARSSGGIWGDGSDHERQGTGAVGCAARSLSPAIDGGRCASLVKLPRS